MCLPITLSDGSLGKPINTEGLNSTKLKPTIDKQ
jgi:hypothetical protein